MQGRKVTFGARGTTFEFKTGGVEIMCKTIKQKVKFNAPPEDVYELLTSAEKHRKFTGKPATISKQIGGKFSIYSGQATGIVVDLCRPKRVVLAWRGHSFPDGIYSMAAFVLTRQKNGGTELVLTHRGVPKEFIPRIEAGWREYYWRRMKNYFSAKR